MINQSQCSIPKRDSVLRSRKKGNRMEGGVLGGHG